MPLTGVFDGAEWLASSIKVSTSAKPTTPPINNLIWVQVNTGTGTVTAKHVSFNGVWYAL